MINPITEDEIQDLLSRHNIPIEDIKEAATHLDQIEAILKKHDDFTRLEALLSVYMRNNPAPRI